MSMTQPVSAQAAAHAAPKRTEFRIIPAIEKSARAIAFAQSSLGKIVLLVLFGVGLRVFVPDTYSVVELTVVIGIIAFLPEYRRVFLALFTIYVALRAAADRPLILASTIGVIVLGAALYSAAMRWPKSLLGQRPVAVLVTGFSLMLILASLARAGSPLGATLWAVVAVFSNYIWFMAYAVSDRGSNPRRDATLEFTAFRPLWGSTTTPFPKGAAYLRKIEARTPEQLAVTQLKGLKLIAWAVIIKFLFDVWTRAFHGYLAIPTSEQALVMSVRGLPVAWHIRWESQLLTFFENVMSMSILGHRIIATCRMAGYNALRNTYRPLSSRTIAEFFNRFYYYFKELLVDFFFYPVFLRYFKKHRRIRLIAANFSAVFFGNAFFHFTRDWAVIRDRGLWPALVNFRVYLVYVAVLTIGISISQVRKRGPKPAGFLRGQLLPVSGVLVFYALLELFDHSPAGYPLKEYVRYAAGFFFIHI